MTRRELDSLKAPDGQTGDNTEDDEDEGGFTWLGTRI